MWNICTGKTRNHQWEKLKKTTNGEIYYIQGLEDSGLRIVHFPQN